MKLKRLWKRHPEGVVGFFLLVVVAAVAVGAPLICLYDPVKQDLIARLLPPGGIDTAGRWHPLGTDPLGRDLWSRVVYGSRISLVVALVAVGIADVIGTVVGLLAGYYRGIVGSVLMRAVDIILAIPFLLLAVATVAVAGPGFENLILVLGLTRWPRYARVAYGQTLSTREAEYVQATRALGAADGRILLRHVLPNIVPWLVVVGTLEVGTMIVFEASLSFLGLGVQPPQPSWGGILADGRNYLATAWWQTTFPGFAILITVLGANFLGDGVRDWMDPRAKQGLFI